ETMLSLLDAGFGRNSGLAIVSVAASASVVNLVGLERILGWVAAVRLPHYALSVPRTARIRAMRLPMSDFSSSSSSSEPVILGPRSLPEPSPARPIETPTRATTRPTRPTEYTLWKRPDTSILGRATDGGSFSPAELKARARIIEETLMSFNIQARVVEVQQGPAITQFGVDPAAGVAVNRIVQRQNDLALRLGAPTLRVLAPVPGRPMVGIEVPNTSVATVKLGDLIASPQFARARLPIGVGMDVAGKPVVADLTRMPHLLVAGATGSGK